MDDDKRTIRIDPQLGWEEAIPDGDFECPTCGSIMIVIPLVWSIYAFCPKCEKYWLQQVSPEDEFRP